MVLGGGNVAIDAARTAPRVGAQDVQIFYRRTIEEMPAWEKDIEEAVEEGIVINPLWAPKRIIHQGGKVTCIEMMRTKTVFDSDGGSHLSVDEEATQVVEADTVIGAIAGGKRSAQAIHRQLSGLSQPTLAPVPARCGQPPMIEIDAAEKMKIQRPQMPMLTMNRRQVTFQQVELGYDEQTARADRGRQSGVRHQRR